MTPPKPRGAPSLLHSRDWMYRKFIIERKTPEEIARLTNKPVMQVYRWLKHHNLERKR